VDYSAALLGASTILLVGITAYYAWQTKRTVDELRMQRDAVEEGERRRRAVEIRSLREGLARELELILSMLEGKSGTGRNFIRLPSSAWARAALDADAIDPAWIEDLFGIYSEVERMNALTDMMLASYATPAGTFDASGIGLERHTSSDFLARAIRMLIPRMRPLSS
jgi:hypothetical protein